MADQATLALVVILLALQAHGQIVPWLKERRQLRALAVVLGLRLRRFESNRALQSRIGETLADSAKEKPLRLVSPPDKNAN